MEFADRVRAREAVMAVVGLGYVGLPLATALARLGFPTLGIDIDAERVACVNAGMPYLADVSADELGPPVREGKLRATTNYARLVDTDVIFICVPTPIKPNKSPDLSYVTAAAREIASRLRRGQLIILQSTTHPGTTEEEVLPLLEESGLKAGTDFHLAFVPERINPGDKHYSIANTPKVVGGYTPTCTELAAIVMEQFGARVMRVSSPRVAEMSKLLENIFRSVNISLVNEMALLAERMRIDFWEVIEAASTKPFGFMPFYPGPGVGGHCIPVDPFYLSAKAREYDFSARFVELAAEINQMMPYHTVEKTANALASRGRSLNGAWIHVLGVAFKRDVDDARNSPAERIIELLLNAGARITYSDPHVPRFAVGGSAIRPERTVLQAVDLATFDLSAPDCIVIVTAHSAFDIDRVLREARLIVDSMNATGSMGRGDRRIFAIGRPNPA
ncbi:MAG: nucleotide sugar dehydrogenase [Chloroflexota bacterium]|nr:nucleotide sugar dehydrogenase [Dehalococcoidia bacterium]MDW8254120.1 nucleotide sugar dehydrogenase [Chloroflexota bacterium]